MKLSALPDSTSVTGVSSRCQRSQWRWTIDGSAGCAAQRYWNSSNMTVIGAAAGLRREELQRRVPVGEPQRWRTGQQSRGLVREQVEMAALVLLVGLVGDDALAVQHGREQEALADPPAARDDDEARRRSRASRRSAASGFAVDQLARHGCNLPGYGLSRYSMSRYITI